MGPKVRAACWFVEQTGGFAAIGSIDDTGAAARRGRDARRARRRRRSTAEQAEPRWRPTEGTRRPTTEPRPPRGTCSRREAVAEELKVEPRAGLTSAEAAERRAQYGPNRFAEAKTEPRWHAFVRQYQDPMQIVLLVAGMISIYPRQAAGHGHRDPRC